jgi:hypothetical protein
MTTDPIDRACERNFVKPGSPLERTVRSHAYKFFTADGSALDERLDSFINEHREDDFYKESFTAAPPARAVGLETLKLSESQRADIAAGKLVVEPSRPAQESATVPEVVRPTVQEFERLVHEGTTAG